MTMYEKGYDAGFSGELPEHHEGLILDSDYSEGFNDAKADKGNQTLEGFARMADDNPDDHNETAGEAFYDNQVSYWDTCEPSEFWEQFEDSYQGTYRSDGDFAQEMAEDCGMIARKVEWPYTCIDWEQAARELMYDYFESGGYYFRNI